MQQRIKFLASGFWLLASGFWLLASGFWLLAAALLSAILAPADAKPTALESSAIHDPALSEGFLLPPRQATGRPSLRIKHYDEARGLIAGYETAGGKRVLFYSRPLPNGAVLAGAFHWDESRQSMWPLMGPGLEDLPEGDGRTVTMLMAGVKIPGVLRDKAAGRAPGPEAQRLKQFLRGEAGRAFSDGVMALYVLLDPYEEDAPRLARLKMPFGAMRMAAELATGQYAGFDHAEELLGKGLANRLRKACEPGQCDYRGRQFMIQRSGLFDMLSTHGKPIASRGSAPSSCAPASASADPFQVPKSGFSVASTSGVFVIPCG